jgi:GT2 family glycosyltransferase
MSVSVVVPTRGRVDALARCLSALAGQSLAPEQTIVVADGADPSTADLVRVDYPGVTLLEREPGGFGAAVNAGAARTSTAWIAILNDDAVPRQSWLAELVACAERHPAAASIASKVVRAEDERVLDGCGDCLTYALKAYRRGLGERDSGQYEREEQVFSASGTACLWRADTFRALGGFDESFLAYYEDVDLGLRARLRRHECWYTPRAVAAHEGAATSRADWAAFESFHAVRNRWLMLARAIPRSWLLRLLPWIVAGELLSLARAVARRNVRLVLRAYADVIRLHPSLRPGSPGATTLPELRALMARRLPPPRMAWWRFRWSARIPSDTQGRPSGGTGT